MRLVPSRPPHMTWARSACSTCWTVSSPAATSNSPSLGIGGPLYQAAIEWSGDGDVLGQVHILDRVQELDAVLERLLERLASGDEAHAAGTLVDHRGLDRVA